MSKTTHKTLDIVSYFDFMRYVEKDPETGCWLWTGAKNNKGYGTFRVDGKTYLTHRLMYETFVGDLKPGLLVCHKCDVRNCVNPEHLFSGTSGDNMQDASRKGRLPGRPRPKKCPAEEFKKYLREL